MATFKYYKYQPMPTARQWFVATILITAAYTAAIKWDFYEDHQAIGAMHDKTYQYYKHYEALKSQPYKPTFKRVE